MLNEKSKCQECTEQRRARFTSPAQQQQHQQLLQRTARFPHQLDHPPPYLPEQREEYLRVLLEVPQVFSS